MPPSYAAQFLPVLIQILIAAAVAGGMIGASAVLGHRVKDKIKNSAYESGMRPVGNARERFSVKFYLVAMLFILFDIEAIFLYPWTVVYRDLVKLDLDHGFSGFLNGLFGFFEMLVFVLLVLCGFFYIWKKGVLNWAVEDKDEPAEENKRAA
jgi:NADH-quinone oxidoreductase subunit A